MKKTIAIVTLTLIFLVIQKGHLAAQNATEEADSIREKVKEKVEAARKNPKAYIGSVTDKTEDTIQLQNDLGEILLISINPEEASFAKIDKKTISAKYDDVGIGDYIISMGFTNGNGVLEAKRVIITSVPETLNRIIISGEVTEVINKQISIINLNNETVTLTFPRSWKGPEIKEIQQGDKVIAVYIKGEGELTIRTIHIASENTLDAKAE